MKIYYSPEFQREYKRLPEKVKEEAKEKERIFRENPFDQRLKTHKLGGKLAGFWAFSVNFQYRVIFRFQPDRSIRFYAIGRHSIYK